MLQQKKIGVLWFFRVPPFTTVSKYNLVKRSFPAGMNGLNQGIHSDMNFNHVTCVTPAAGKEAVFFNGDSYSVLDIHLIDTKIYIALLCNKG